MKNQKSQLKKITIRIDPLTWGLAKKLAREQGMSLNRHIEDAIRAYNRGVCRELGAQADKKKKEMEKLLGEKSLL